MKKELIIFISITLAVFACSKANNPYSNTTLSKIMTYNTLGNPVSIDVSHDYLIVAENATGVSLFDRSTGSLYQRIENVYILGANNDSTEVQLRSTYMVKYVPERNYLFIGHDYNAGGDASRICLFGARINDPREPVRQIFSSGSRSYVNDLFYEINEGNDRVFSAFWNSLSGNNFKMMRFRVNVNPGQFDDPFEEVWVSNDLTPNQTNGIAVFEDFIITSMGQYGVYIVRRDDFSHVSTTYTPGEAQDVKIKENYIYVADRHFGLQVIDATDMYAPKIIKNAARNTTGYATTLDICDDILALSSNSGGIYLFNITNPSNPKLITRDANYGYVYKVRFYEKDLYVASREHGVIRFEVKY